MNQYQEFKSQCESHIKKQSLDQKLDKYKVDFISQSFSHKYPYNFEFLGRPIIQYPQDMVAMQELIWQIKPDLIIETGIAHGGSLVMSASMMAMLDICDAIDAGEAINPNISNRKVLGIDIEIREHNRKAIEAHPMSSRIHMIQGSSIDPEIISQVKEFARGYNRTLVALDSNHTHEHVLAELEAYAHLASVGSYCVVFDTVVEDLPESMSADRPWGPGNNPKTAVWEYLKSQTAFEIDRNIQNKILITVAPDGFLRKVR